MRSKAEAENQVCFFLSPFPSAFKFLKLFPFLSFYSILGTEDGAEVMSSFLPLRGDEEVGSQ